MYAPLEKGLIVELDYTVPGGSKFLFDTVRQTLAAIDAKLQLTIQDEARFLAGRPCEAALGEYFARLKCKKTAPKAARDLAAAVRAAFTKALPSLMMQATKNFLKAIAATGVKTMLVTCADVEDAGFAAAMAPFVGEKVVLEHEDMSIYGGLSSAAIKRLVNVLRIPPSRLALVMGSGHSVKEALKYGLCTVAVESAHTAYQDYSGVTAVVPELGAPAAKRIAEILRA